MASQTTDLTIEEIFARGDALLAKQQLRKDRPWTYDIIRVLWGAPASGLSLKILYRELWAMRSPTDLNMPKAFEASVRSTLNHHTSQSSRWNKKAEDDLFYSPGGTRGMWALRDNRAEAWLRHHGLPVWDQSSSEPR